MSKSTIPAILALAFTLAACDTPRHDMASQQDIDGNVHLCSSCHGITGRPVSPNFPILAAQQADYIEAQLHAFRDHSRADPHAHTYMWGMAAHLDDAAIKSLAAYFSSRPAVPGQPVDEASTAEAKVIFTNGVAAIWPINCGCSAAMTAPTRRCM
jgi:cytochrome c553